MVKAAGVIAVVALAAVASAKPLPARQAKALRRAEAANQLAARAATAPTPVQFFSTGMYFC